MNPLRHEIVPFHNGAFYLNVNFLIQKITQRRKNMQYSTCDQDGPLTRSAPTLEPLALAAPSAADPPGCPPRLLASLGPMFSATSVGARLLASLLAECRTLQIPTPTCHQLPPAPTVLGEPQAAPLSLSSSSPPGLPHLHQLRQGHPLRVI